jgi:hypothetical protein
VNPGTDDHALVAISTAAVAGAPASFIVSRKMDYSLVRVGLNYRFDPPVVAKY